MPDLFMLVDPVTFIVGVLAVIAVGWLAKRNFGG